MSYQPNAAEFRRFFYLLSSISLVGSADSLLTTAKSRLAGPMTGADLHGSAFHRVHARMSTDFDLFSLALALLVALLHAIAFVCTLLMTAQDVLIYNRNGASSTGSAWAAQALADSTFSAGLAQWKGLDTARLVCAVVAWLG